VADSLADDTLTPEQTGIAHAAKQMLENHTCLTGFHFRYVEHMPEFFRTMIVPSIDVYPSVAVKLFRYTLPTVMKVRNKIKNLCVQNFSMPVAFFTNNLA
jgi:hypothetical protein